MVKRKTANSRLKRALSALSEWCRKNLHVPIKEQHQKLTQKLRGRYGYYGIIGNFASLQRFREGNATDLAMSAVSATPRQASDVAQISSPGEAMQLPGARVVHGLLSSVAKS